MDGLVVDWFEQKEAELLHRRRFDTVVFLPYLDVSPGMAQSIIASVQCGIIKCRRGKP